jgi:hypothetical protein
MTSVDVDSAATLSQRVESHLIATYDGRVIRIYIDGLLDTEVAAPGSVPPTPPTDQNLVESGVGIGNNTQRDRPFNGLIDEVALYPAALSATRALAHYHAQFAELVSFQYATNLICGDSDDAPFGQYFPAPGTYFTEISIHNPLDRPVQFGVKVAIGRPGLRADPVSHLRQVELGPDEALVINCRDVRGLGGSYGFIEGFVIIETATELDVVTVHTASGSEDDHIRVLHTDRVPARRTPFRPSHICIDFRPPREVGEQYGARTGLPSGTVIMRDDGVIVSVVDYEVDGNTFFDSATIDEAPAALGTDQALRLDYIGLDIDFSELPFTVREVRFEYLDPGGPANLAVNGSPVLVGDLASTPATLDGVAISVTSTTVMGGTRGAIVLMGSVTSLRIGGHQLWIDNICASA